MRFGIGTLDGVKSSTWRVWGGSDSTVYIASRDIGNTVKVSLHPRDPQRPGGEWRFALLNESIDVVPELRERLSGRVIEAWDSGQTRLGDGPLRQGFAVVLGRFSVGAHAQPADLNALAEQRRRLAGVSWVELPPPDQAWQFTTLVADPGVSTTPPGVRAMGAIPVGRLTLPDGAAVWVMRHLIDLTDADRDFLERAARAMVARLGMVREQRVYRTHAPVTTDTLRAFIEVAVTLNAPPGVLDG